MPITKSAKKALKQSKKRRIRNLRRFGVMRENIKQIKRLVEENKKEEALKLLPSIYKAIDKAAKNNVIKKNTASRKKSRLTKLINRPKTNQPQNDKATTLPPTTPEQS